MDHFIERVRQYPFLWDTNHVSYRDIGRKDSAWEAIAKKCGLASGQEAKLQWKKLRDSHREAMRRRKTGQTVQHIRPWKYEELMSFLTPQFNNSTVSNLSKLNSAESQSPSTESPLSAAKTPESSLPATISSPTRSSPLSAESSRSVSIPSNRTSVDKFSQSKPFNPSKAVLLKDRYKQREQRLIERDIMRHKLFDMNRPPQDALSNLFTSFCQKTRQLPKYLQLRVEREIFNVVSRAEEEALSLSSANNFLSHTSSSYEYTDDTSYQNSPLPDNAEDNKPSYISLIDVSAEFPPQSTNITSHEPQDENESSSDIPLLN